MLQCTRLISDDNVENKCNGYVKNNNLLCNYDIGDRIELDISFIPYEDKKYFIFKEETIKFLNNESTNNIINIVKYFSNNICSDINKLRKTMYDPDIDILKQNCGLIFVYLTGAKILKHLKKDCFQARLFKKDVSNYLSVINDKRFCKVNYLGNKFKGYALIEISKNLNNVDIDYDFYLQAMFGKVYTQKELEKIRNKKRKKKMEQNYCDDCSNFDYYDEYEFYENSFNEYDKYLPDYSVDYNDYFYVDDLYDVDDLYIEYDNPYDALYMSGIDYAPNERYDDFYDYDYDHFLENEKANCVENIIYKKHNNVDYINKFKWPEYMDYRENYKIDNPPI